MSESPSRRKFLTSLGGATAISLASYGHGRATFFPTAKGGARQRTLLAKASPE
jgi:hypothetical protein